MRIYMQTPTAENQPPRYYHLHMEKDLFEGWIVTKEWGSQGASGRLLKKYFKSAEEAEHEMMSTRDKQIKRGFRVVFVEGQNNPQ